jgi:hypothetical protein
MDNLKAPKLLAGDMKTKDLKCLTDADKRIPARWAQWIKFSLFAALLVMFHPGQSEAVPIVRAPVIVPLSGDVITTYIGNSALFSNDLYLQSPTGAYSALIYNNHFSPPGTEVNLGFFGRN